jgi:hypothetical protein
MRLKITLMSIVAMAVIAVGCGGGDDGGTSAGTGGGETTTRNSANAGKENGNAGQENGNAEKQGGGATGSAKPKGQSEKQKFIAAGDAICETVPKRYTAKLKTLGKESSKNGRPEPSTAEKNLKAAIPPLYLAIEEFEELTPPQGEEQTFEAIVEALEEAAKGLEKEPSAELTGPKSPFAKFQKLTTGYGFEVCKNL